MRGNPQWGPFPSFFPLHFLFEVSFRDSQARLPSTDAINLLRSKRSRVYHNNFYSRQTKMCVPTVALFHGSVGH